jgi:hypothetical protein
MAKFSDRKGQQKGTEKVQMLPNNGLGDPVRSYDSTFSAVNVIKKMFLAHKATPSA